MLKRSLGWTAIVPALFALTPNHAQKARAEGATESEPLGCFGGTGGPNGDFDWVVRDGDVFLFDTTSTLIVGGPDGVPTTTQLATNGVVDVRNLLIEEGAVVRVQGPNPLRILATGEVIVRGLLDLSGFDAKDVATLNTGNQIEVGGAGAAGGGWGGVANGNTTSSTPEGGAGEGPFGLPGGGGGGGESAFAPFELGKDARRPGGGGGGRFARDLGASDEGLAATSGGNGNSLGQGALSGVSPAAGGQPGPAAFQDAKSANDFWGVRPVFDSRGHAALIRGELSGLLAGSGGGGGGNAIPSDTFPNPGWSIGSDEKGGPGGGGGGGLHVQALGSIVFGALGEIRANGGRGATGENTFFLDHVGGTGGSGSGGHLVLESATRIDFTDGGTQVDALPRNWLQAVGRPTRIGPTGQLDPCCIDNSNGGAGGPGVIQLHVPQALLPPSSDPSATGIVVPEAVAHSRNPLAQLASPAPLVVFPTCDPFPTSLDGWFGGAGRRMFQRLAHSIRLHHAWTEPPAEPGLERPDLLDLSLRWLSVGR